MKRRNLFTAFAISAALFISSIPAPAAFASAADPPVVESEIEESETESGLPENETEPSTREEESETIEESETETEIEESNIESEIEETETEAEEENPVVEVTEHGIAITRSCAEAIDRKLWNLNDGKFDYRDFWTFRIYTSERIDPAEFAEMNYVTRGYEDKYQIDGEFVYEISFSEYLTMREKAALFADDERVTGIWFNYDIMPSIYPTVVSDRQYFRDDDPKAYYHKPLCWAVVELITRMPVDASFGVGEKCSRKDFVIFLWRTSGRMVSAKYHSIHTIFNDIGGCSFDSDAYRALTWAVNEGIVKGFQDGGFHPDDAVSRKDALIMMYRAFGEVVSGEVPFKDVQKRGCAKDSDTYRAIVWAVEKEITKGYSDGTFRPLDPCLREQAVTFLCRMVNPRFY